VIKLEMGCLDQKLFEIYYASPEIKGYETGMSFQMMVKIVACLMAREEVYTIEKCSSE
jgi:hypothetical protein